MRRTKWTREKVIATIRRRHRQGGPVTCVWNGKKTLYYAAIRHVGSWQAALLAADVRPTRVSRTKEEIIQALQELQAQGVVMSHVGRLHSAVYYAASQRFGGWHRALAAAGITPPEPKWTKQRIIEAIQSRYQSGMSLAQIAKEDRSLRTATYNHFCSFYRAVMAAGVPVRPPRRWSRESVLAAIRSRHERGLPLVGIWRDDKGLEVAARNYFGTWENAVRAAGLPTKMRWTKERVLEAIQRRREQGLSLDNMRSRDGVLYRAARKQWGSWSLALEAAGMTVRPLRQWSSEAMLEEIRASYRQGTLSTWWKRDRSFVHSARRRFGSWPAALRAAGVPVYRITWSKAAVIKAIKRRHRDGLPLSTTSSTHVALYGAAKRYFGTWRNALSAAGFTCGRQSWSRQRVIDTIHRRLSTGASMVELRANQALTCAAYVYFGGWGAALRAAGIDYQPPRRWSKQLLLDEIRSRHERGLPLVTSCREISYLVEAACRHFGTWGAALATAGVPPKQQHWTKEAIIQAIQERFGEHVESPVHSRKLEEAARRHFGSWANALSAAGVMSPQERLRQQVVEILQDRYVKGESLESLTADAGLIAAAKRAFRSWPKAVVAAGLKGCAQ